MAPSTTRAADEMADSIRTLIDRVVDARVTQEVARRGQDVAGILAERGAGVGERANEAWRDSRPIRRDVGKRLSRAGDDATKWSNRTWRRSLRPMLRDLWNRRTVAAGAAGAAIPASRELVDTAAARLGIKRREERHWGAFFLGLVVGAVAGAIVALLTAPKRGDEVRRELGARADEVRREVAQRAEEISTKARDEWVPLFQGGETNGHTEAGGAIAGTAGTAAAADAGTLEEAATERNAATGEAAEQAATDAAEAINESYESVDREPTT